MQVNDYYYVTIAIYCDLSYIVCESRGLMTKVQACLLYRINDYGCMSLTAAITVATTVACMHLYSKMVPQ